jgi:hypothetical protein
MTDATRKTLEAALAKEAAKLDGACWFPSIDQCSASPRSKITAIGRLAFM